MRRLNGTLLTTFALALGIVLAAQPAALFAQSSVKPETLVGKYEGTATMDGGSGISLKVELRLDNGAVVGTGESDQGPFTITATTITADKVVMTMNFGGMTGSLAGVMKGDKIEGSWAMADMGGGFLLTKAASASAAKDAPAAPAPSVAAPAAAKPADAPAANAADPISGQWNGVTGQGDQTVGFVLTVKLDGEKVTGDINSDQGGAPLSAGAWKDGTLTLSFEFGSMTATMVGALKEGKLVGTIDIGGQMQMPWAAVKK